MQRYAVYEPMESTGIGYSHLSRNDDPSKKNGSDRRRGVESGKKCFGLMSKLLFALAVTYVKCTRFRLFVKGKLRFLSK